MNFMLINIQDEFTIRRGRFIAVSPKSYFAYNADDNQKKTAYKGLCFMVS